MHLVILYHVYNTHGTSFSVDDNVSGDDSLAAVATGEVAPRPSFPGETLYFFGSARK